MHWPRTAVGEDPEVEPEPFRAPWQGQEDVGDCPFAALLSALADCPFVEGDDWDAGPAAASEPRRGRLEARSAEVDAPEPEASPETTPRRKESGENAPEEEPEAEGLEPESEPSRTHPREERIPERTCSCTRSSGEEASEAERHAAALLVALAESPFPIEGLPAQRPPTKRAATCATSSPSSIDQLFTHRGDDTFEEAALVATRAGTLLARHGRYNAASLSAALARPEGLGGSVRALRAKAAAGDFKARGAVQRLDVARREAWHASLGGSSSAAAFSEARARRLRLALELPEQCAARLAAIEDAITLCDWRELSGAAMSSSPGEEPEDEACIEAEGLLEWARAEVGLSEALAADAVEL